MGHDERDDAAGDSDRAPRLKAAAWAGALLNRIDDRGFITVEQERDPRHAGGSLADVKASRDSLGDVGF